MAWVTMGTTFRAFPPSPALCERCWHEQAEHAGDACPEDQRDPTFGAAGW